VMDVVIGGGTDSVFSNNGIMAYNGVDGSLLWKRSSRNEVFGSAIFQDITADGISDVIIVGRSAQLLAIDGVNGALLWDYFPYSTNPSDSGLFNFYNPQFIHDVDGDTYPDILVANGGDHAAPAWQSNRPPGHLMVVSALTGNLIVKAVVPDSSEIYCSAIVADIQNTGSKWILYGTGGEHFGGNFYAVLLDDLLLGDLTGSIVLASDLNKGFVAPAAIHKTASGVYDIVIQSFDGLVTKINGQTFSPIWTYQKPGTESSAEPVIGNFTGDLTPDVLLVLFKGVAPSYNDYYQVMLDGNDGSVRFLDSLGAINFASANSVDLNNDGRDEGLYSITYLDSGYFKSRVESIDFTTNIINTLDQTRTGVNIASTPLITDLDNDGLLDLVYSVKRDSLNPMGWKGIYVYRHELSSIIPNSGIAWGSYLGTNMDGVYNSELINCGNGSLISSVNRVHPSCNGFSDGGISLGVVGGSSHYTYLWSNQSTDSSIQNLQAGAYWVQVTDSTGCYELRTINLLDPFAIIFGGIIPPTCVGDSNGIATVSSSGCSCMFSGCTYLWDNGVTTKTDSSLPIGWSSVIITHVSGCVVVDSVLLTINNSTGSSSENSCDSYTWDGVAYTTSGSYTNTYTNISGCDSVHTLNLTINNSNTGSSSENSCDSYTWDGVTYITSGSYTNTYTNISGCDSVHTLNLTINNSNAGSSSENSCDSYTWNGQTYTTSGAYSWIGTNTEGCDSTATLNLTINTPTSSTATDVACDSYTWNGQTYTTSGAYSWIGTNAVGCDSTATLTLTINNATTSTDVQIACDTYTWINGNAYTANNNTATYITTNSNGCDSVITLDLTITGTPIATVSQVGLDLEVSVVGGNAPYSYQWNTTETTQQITPTANGTYWVIVEDINQCISDTIYFNVTWISTDITELNIVDLSIYPNPSEDIFNITFTSEKTQDIEIRIFNAIGECVFIESKQQFVGKYTTKTNLSEYSKSIYFLEIETDEGIINKKLILQ